MRDAAWSGIFLPLQLHLLQVLRCTLAVLSSSATCGLTKCAMLLCACRYQLILFCLGPVSPHSSPINNLSHPLRLSSIITDSRKHPHLPVWVWTCTNLQFRLLSAASQRKPDLRAYIQIKEASVICLILEARASLSVILLDFTSWLQNDCSSFWQLPWAPDRNKTGCTSHIYIYI